MNQALIIPLNIEDRDNFKFYGKLNFLHKNYEKITKNQISKEAVDKLFKEAEDIWKFSKKELEFLKNPYNEEENKKLKNYLNTLNLQLTLMFKNYNLTSKMLNELEIIVTDQVLGDLYE